MPDAARARLERYIRMRAEKPLSQMDDTIHGIHFGTEWEAELRLSDLAAALTQPVLPREEGWMDTLRAELGNICSIASELRAMIAAAPGKVEDEEVQVLHEWLDDQKAPRGEDDGDGFMPFSLLGRVGRLFEAAESSRDDLLRQLEEAKGEVEVLRENFAQERLLKNTAHVELIRAGREIEEWRASAAGYGSDALAEKVLREQAEAERDNLGESMRNYARYSELYLERAETAEAQVAALTAQRDALLEGLDRAIVKHEAGENHDEGAYDDDCSTCRVLADLRSLRAAYEAAAHNSGEGES